MTTWIVLLIQAAGAAFPGAAAVWVREDFERYRSHEELLAAWPCAEGCQDARKSIDQSIGRGHYSFHELPGEGTRHLRVFDPTNSVTGTDAHPLRFICHLYIERNSSGTHRCVELRNSATGQRLAMGPGPSSTKWRVFDGIEWRDLAYAPPRAIGWNAMEMVVKTDVLVVRVSNALGQSYEEAPRAARSGYGVCALGSGRSNAESPTYIDNVLIDGGTLCEPDAAHELALVSPASGWVGRVNEAVALNERAKPRDALAALENLLTEVEGVAAASGGAAPAAVAVLPWIYETIAAVKGHHAPIEELQRIHYEAIARSPGGIGVQAAVRNLAELLPEPGRTRLLLNLARRHAGSPAAEAAVGALIDRPGNESSNTGMSRFNDLVVQGGDTLLPEGAVRASLARGAAGDARILLVLAWLGDQPVAADLARQHGEKLLEERQRDRIERLAQAMEAQGFGGPARAMREIVFRVRLDNRDVFGALAALTDRPLAGAKASLLAELAALNRPAAVRAALNGLVPRAVRAGPSLRFPRVDAPLPESPEMLLWEVIATFAEKASMPTVAAAAYQVLAGAARPAPDGSPLTKEFAVSAASPEQLATFWKSQFLITRKRFWEADGLLENLTRSAEPTLAAQAAFDLAQARLVQYRPQCATRPAAVCENLLPGSAGVRDLKVSIEQNLRQQEERRRLHEQAGQAWQRAGKATDARQAADALMAAAQIELQLGMPERAAEALEGLIAKYPEAPVLPAALGLLARLYEEELGMVEKSQALRDRLARDFPDHPVDHPTGS